MMKQPNIIWCTYILYTSMFIYKVWEEEEETGIIFLNNFLQALLKVDSYFLLKIYLQRVGFISSPRISRSVIVEVRQVVFNIATSIGNTAYIIVQIKWDSGFCAVCKPWRLLPLTAFCNVVNKVAKRRDGCDKARLMVYVFQIQLTQVFPLEKVLVFSVMVAYV